MKARCTNTKSQNWVKYGGRGITVCERWRASFEAFIADVGHRPSPEHSIDRINNDGNYEPTNVRWATKAEQSRNRRQVTNVTIDGETRTLSEWCREFGVGVTTAFARIRKHGWDPIDAVKVPAKTRSKRWKSDPKPVEAAS